MMRGARFKRTMLPLSRPIDNHENIVIKEFGVENLDRNHSSFSSEGDGTLEYRDACWPFRGSDVLVMMQPDQNH